MITVVSATNRSGNRTRIFARCFVRLLREAGAEAQLLDLTAVGPACFGTAMYDPAAMAPELVELQDEYVLAADKFAFFVPEYNGSYPGILKLFIDGISVRETAASFGGKTAALVGIASGRAGNLRGMDHLADALNHMGCWTLPGKLPISAIHRVLTDDAVTDEATLTALSQLASQLIAAVNRKDIR